MTTRADVESLRRDAEKPGLVWVDRPILLHDRADGTSGPCNCGCGSWDAHVVERRAHIQMLINRRTGVRRRRSVNQDGTPRSDAEVAEFDRLANTAERVYMPLRSYAKQLRAILARPKVKGLFGGVRGGKTAAMTEEAGDAWCEFGGRGVELWWVAPTLKDTLRGVRKLVTGEAIKTGHKGRSNPPLFPSALVRSYPGEGRDDKAALEQIKRSGQIILIDGTKISLRYGKGDGSTLKGDPVPWIGVDEGAEIMDPEPWHVMLQRTTDAGGRLVTSTTPKAGSPLKSFIFDEGVDLAEAANIGNYVCAYAHLTARDNPWISEVNLAETIAGLEKFPNSEDLIKQDVDGLWIVPGHRMWEHWDETKHLIEGPWRSCESYHVDGRTLVNITPVVAGAFFLDTTAKHLDRVLGQDFNARGHFTVDVQLAVPMGMNQNDPDNWVVVVHDEICKRGESYTAARFLAKQAGAYRGLDHKYYEGLAIACDPSGAHDQPPERVSNRTNIVEAFSHADAYIRAGFDCRPAHLTVEGKPRNPGKIDQCALMHMVMRVRDGNSGPTVRMLVNKTRCPRLVKSLREQTANERGVPKKRSDTKSDIISDPVDALLYVLWALLAETEFYPTAKVSY